MNILSNLEIEIKEFNLENNMTFSIDTIRTKFSKEYKLEPLKKLGNWHKLKKNSYIIQKLKRRYVDKEITSVYQLENYNIYYYNSNEDKPKYKKATMVIFGMKQYHKEPPPYNLIDKIISILKNITNVDICFDMNKKPNIENISSYYNVKQYIKNGLFYKTYYINETFNNMIERITIYDKAYKNKLDFPLWRIEAKVIIPNIKVLALPLHEFRNFVNML
ncbi:MAG: hypothetical protein PHD79_03650 [Aliarcobacter sp.]|nr:hypothetical protein [Aliarcobacter sp.]